jgi:hypothetical protein
MNLKKIWRSLEYYSLVLSWLGFGWWMWQDYLRDPGQITTYGHNRPNEYWLHLKIGLVELVLLYLALYPWDKEGLGWRMFFTLILWFCWMCFLGFMTIHSGGMSMIHLFWLLSVNIVLFVGLFIKGIQVKARRRNQ